MFRPGLKSARLFFCLQFLSFGLESVEDNSEHDLAGMADQADSRIVRTLLEVAFPCSFFCTPVLLQCLCTSIFSAAVSGRTDQEPRL